MIAHRIPENKRRDNAGRLVRYLLSVPERSKGDDSAWERVAGYITDPRVAGRVAAVRVTNCASDDARWAIAEISATQAQNTRSKGSKTYHLVVSFQEGERPTDAQLVDIENTLCAAIGLGDHQRISALHTDTDNLHFHVAINKVHPVTLRNVEPFYDYQKLGAACVELEQRHDLQADNHLARPRGEQQSVGAAKVEHFSGRESFTSWAKERAAEILGDVDKASTWADLHHALAVHGLQIGLRGAGLVVRPVGQSVHMKASDVGRAMSFQRLTERFGEFVEAADRPLSPDRKRSYTGRPRQPAVPSELYTRFQQSRNEAIATRGLAQRSATAARDQYAAQLATWHREQRARVRQNQSLSRGAKRLAYQRLASERRTDWFRHREAVRLELAAVRHANPLPTWQDWLRAEATDGNALALVALRRKDTAQLRATYNLLTAANPAAVKAAIYAGLRPVTSANGNQVYVVGDGGQVTDRRGDVRVDQLTGGAAVLALSLAAERFGTQPLQVHGSDEFREAIAAAAVRLGLSVRFADGLGVGQDGGVHGAAPASAIDQFVADRNRSIRSKPSNILTYRAWGESDVGKSHTLHALTETSDGWVALLTRSPNEVVAKAVSPTAATSLQGLRPGARFSFDRNDQLQRVRTR